MEGVTCPCCQRQVSRNADECPNCGFRSEVRAWRGLIGSLGTISSILLGFGLAGLAEMYSVSRFNDQTILVVEGIWLIASLLLLAVVVLAEISRHQEPARASTFCLSDPFREWLEKRIGLLLTLFILALALTAIGLISLAFTASTIHGVIGVVGAVVLWIVVTSAVRTLPPDEPLE